MSTSIRCSLAWKGGRSRSILSGAHALVAADVLTGRRLGLGDDEVLNDEIWCSQAKLGSGKVKGIIRLVPAALDSLGLGSQVDSFLMLTSVTPYIPVDLRCVDEMA